MTDRSHYSHSLTLLERALAGVDLVLGIGVLALAALWIMPALLPDPPDGDKAVIGLIAGAAMLPVGLAALAASHALRNQWKRRWLLQTVAAAPFVALLVALLIH